MYNLLLKSPHTIFNYSCYVIPCSIARHKVSSVLVVYQTEANTSPTSHNKHKTLFNFGDLDVIFRLGTSYSFEVILSFDVSSLLATTVMIFCVILYSNTLYD